MLSIVPYPSNLPGDCQDKVVELIRLDATLNANIPKPIRKPTEELLRLVNSFYSNKIEGNPTLPREILKSQLTRSNAAIPSKGIAEILAHREVQLKIDIPSLRKEEAYDPSFMKFLHREFYKNLPEEQLIIKDTGGNPVKDKEGELITVKPGEFREHEVQVGQHHPPSPSELEADTNWFASAYDPSKLYGTDKLVAAICAHHRFAWIHPFADGNGRVGRLLTDCHMSLAGLGGYGLWTMSRGFGRDTQSYYKALSEADMPRQGGTDGRGTLSDKGLLSFFEYFIDTALDQVRYFSSLLDPQNLRMRIDIYFEYRARETMMGLDGKQLHPLKIEAREIYRTLLERGNMSKTELYGILGKDEATIRPILGAMEKEQLISSIKRQNINLLLSPSSVEVLFPQLW